MNLIAETVPVALERTATATAGGRTAARRRAGFLLGAAGMLVAAWVLGNVLAVLVPQKWSSMALVEVQGIAGPDCLNRVREKLASTEVTGRAASGLAGSRGDLAAAPVDGYLLRNSLETAADRNGQLLIAVRGRNAREAQERMRALVDAYHSITATEHSGSTPARSLHVQELEPVQVEASAAMRMVLGMAAAACMALALAIPLLKQLERLTLPSPLGRPATA